MTRVFAPCAVGRVSVSWAFWQVSTRASQVRAPWSRRSRPSVPSSGSVPGWGAESAASADLITAASSTVPRPRSRTPPRPSSTMARNRLRCAERSCLSRCFSSRRATPSGSRTSSRCSPAAWSSVALRSGCFGEQQRLGLGAEAERDREQVDHLDDHLGLLGGDGAGVQRGPGGREVVDQALAGAQQPSAPAVPGAGGGGEVVLGRAPLLLRLGGVGGVDLDHGEGLDRGEGGPEPFELEVGGEQLGRGLRRPQRRGQLADGRPGAGDHVGQGGRRGRGRVRRHERQSISGHRHNHAPV